MEGNLEEVQRLLEEKGSDLNKEDNDGRTPLHLALVAGVCESDTSNYVGVVTCLLEHGANPNLHDHYGDTPLCHAVATNQDEMIKSLLDRADERVDSKQKEKQSTDESEKKNKPEEKLEVPLESLDEDEPVKPKEEFKKQLDDAVDLKGTPGKEFKQPRIKANPNMPSISHSAIGLPIHIIPEGTSFEPS